MTTFHHPLRAAGAVLLGVGLLTGCAGASSTPAPPAAPAPVVPTPPGTPSAPVSAPSEVPSGVQLSVTVAGGEVMPPAANVAVPVGSPVRLTVTSDVADVVHVHDYDLEKKVPAGGTVTFDFTADRTGTFEVETHESGLLLVKLVVS